uniref:Uncharacterized protein n=1 Tax=Setaria italica TaxID=4555 RepID=K4A0N2_SETIT
MPLCTWKLFYARLRRQQPKERRKGLDTLFMLVIWSLWKEHNAGVFNQCSSSTQELLQRIKQESEHWVLAGARQLGRLFIE